MCRGMRLGDERSGCGALLEVRVGADTPLSRCRRTGGATKLEYIDASEREIARALGRPGRRSRGSHEWLSGGIPHAGLVEALRHGRAPRVPVGLHVMGWFNYLLLSCHAAALSPSVAHSDRFRDRLQARLGLEQGLSELSGLATLWERAERWCRHRHGLGEPIRLISLPDPGNMSQIGYTVRIAFPSRLDLRRMERLFQNLPPRARATADTVVAAVRSVLAERGWSQGFRRAFDDFARRRHDGERLLEDHPFWIAVRNLERPGAAADKAPHVQLELRTDFEGEATYTVTTASAVILDALGGAAAPFAADDVQSVDITEAQLLSFLGDGPHGLPDGLRRCHAGRHTVRRGDVGPLGSATDAGGGKGTPARENYDAKTGGPSSIRDTVLGNSGRRFRRPARTPSSPRCVAGCRRDRASSRLAWRVA